MSRRIVTMLLASVVLSLAGCSLVSLERQPVAVIAPDPQHPLPDISVRSKVEAVDYPALLRRAKHLNLADAQQNRSGYVIEVEHTQTVHGSPLTSLSYFATLFTLGLLPSFETIEEHVGFVLINGDDRIDAFSYERRYKRFTGLLMGFTPALVERIDTATQIAEEAVAAYQNHLTSSATARDEFKAYFEALDYYGQ